MADKESKKPQVPVSSASPSDKAPATSGGDAPAATTPAATTPAAATPTAPTPAASAPTDAPAEEKPAELKIEQPPAAASPTETPAQATPAAATPAAEEKKEAPSVKFETETLPHAGAPTEGDDAVEEEEEEKSSKLFWIIAAILFVLILIVGGAAWYANSQGKSITDILLYRGEGEETEEEEPAETALTEELEDEDEEEVVDETTLVVFTGDSVTAELPEDWTITEYFNGDGSTMLVEGVSYSGLTGLTVANGDAVTLFQLEGVYGIGGVGACEEYYQFSDSSAVYYQEMVDNSALNDVVPVVVEIADDTYTEFELFDERLRRVDHTLYRDTTETTVSFDAGCGMSHSFLTLTTLSFDGDGTHIDSHQHTVRETATDEELEQLDAVLESLEIL